MERPENEVPLLTMYANGQEASEPYRMELWPVDNPQLPLEWFVQDDNSPDGEPWGPCIEGTGVGGLTVQQAVQAARRHWGTPPWNLRSHA